MTRAAIGSIASVLVLASIALAPEGVFADRRRGESDEPPPRRLHAVPPKHFAPHHRGPLFAPHPFFRGPVVRGVVVVPPPPAYPPPVYVTPPPFYDPWAYAPPPMYGPPVGSVPDGTVSVAPPMPNVIEYPHGRYELRGDGITTPYQWAWIPNPPPGPPADASAAPEPARPAQLYRWTDEQGAVHWTDRIDAVPEKYRAGAKQTQPS